MTKIPLSRAEVLDGLSGRINKQASTVLMLIESRTAYLVAQAQQAMNQFLTEVAVEERNRTFLDAIALGREPPVPPTIQDLERYAPQWAALTPENSSIRAAVAHWLGQKYRFAYATTPQGELQQTVDLQGADGQVVQPLSSGACQLEVRLTRL